MTFWHALLTAALTVMLVESDQADHPFPLKITHDGLVIFIVWLAWRWAERREKSENAE